MTEKEFFDKLLLTYSEKVSEDLPGDGLGYYLEYFLDNYLYNELIAFLKDIVYFLIYVHYINENIFQINKIYIPFFLFSHE